MGKDGTVMSAEQSLAEKYGLLACIQCGKCSAGCPVSLKGPLNIRKIVGKVAVDSDLGPIYQQPELWDCTTCSVCTLRCPRGLEPHQLIVSLRSALVDSGNVPVTVRDALEATFKQGNPYGQPRSQRSQWTGNLTIKDFSRGAKAEMLYFVCCAAAYDPRVQEAARAQAQVLSRAGVDFGILGNEENCCGNEIRRMGEVGLGDMLKQKNIDLFSKYGITRIVTASPHCYNTLKNEYQDARLHISHYTQLFAELIKGKKPTLSHETRRRVAYHDPCFLGKQNHVFDEPRLVLGAIPGVTLVEFDRSRERSLCCEGGGGRMWVDTTDSVERLGVIRVKEALALGVDVVATACPFCLLNIRDAVKTLGVEERLQVMDIAEMVLAAL